MRKDFCWYDKEDHPHSTMAECQVAELKLLGFKTEEASEMVNKAAQVINILNVTAKSRLAARKLNGAKRKSRSKPEQPSIPALESAPPF